MTKTVRKKYTKSAQKVQKKVQKEFFYFADIYVCDNFVVFFLFYFFLFDYQWKSRVSSSLKPFFKFLMFLFYFIKIN